MDVSDAAARDTAVRLLAFREHTRLELEQKLVGRGFASQATECAIASVAAQGLQSDERFADVYVRSALNRGQGPLKIRAGLRQRGVDGDLVRKVLDLPDEEWRARADAAVRKRFGAAPPSERAEWARRVRFLAGRGFPEATARRVLGDLDAL